MLSSLWAAIWPSTSAITAPPKVAARRAGKALAACALAISAAAWTGHSTPDLQIAPERPGGYHRTAFAHGWATVDGCSTRDRVLAAESLIRVPSCHDITGGQWTSPYDNITVTDPHRLDIDHLVPLQEAWRSGASAWTADQRHRYYNDLDHPTLIAVTATSNRSKGSKDPAHWWPPDRSYRCEYAHHWIDVKQAWHLTADPDEMAALRAVLRTCPDPPA